MFKATRFLWLFLAFFAFFGCAAKNSPDRNWDFRAVQVERARINGADIGYRSFGRGEPLLMIMGYAGEMDVWDQNLVRELARSFRVIMFDNRGMGYSTAGPEPVSMSLLGRDAGGLLDHLEIDKAHVMGWSMGSVAAQELALARPEKIGSLVLYGSVSENGPVLKALERMGRMDKQGLRDLLFPADWAKAHPEIYGLLPSPRKSPDPNVVAGQRQALVEWPGTVERLSGLDKPVLLVVGEQDEITPARESLKIASLVKGAWIMRFNSAGHWLMYQAPQAVARGVANFLRTGSRLVPEPD